MQIVPRYLCLLKCLLVAKYATIQGTHPPNLPWATAIRRQSTTGLGTGWETRYGQTDLVTLDDDELAARLIHKRE